MSDVLRQKENDGSLMAQKDKQSKIDKQIQELVKDRKNKLKHISKNQLQKGQTIPLTNNIYANILNTNTHNK